MKKKKKKYVRPTMRVVPVTVESSIMMVSSYNTGEGPDIKIHQDDDDIDDGEELSKQHWGCHWNLWEDDDELKGY